MGQHKPALRLFGANSPDLLGRTVGLLRACTDEVWVSCRRGQTVADLHCVYDRVEGIGPIGAVHALLHELADSSCDAALVLSCDLPFMNAATLDRLIAAREQSTASSRLLTNYVQDETGYMESLVAIYEQDALPFFETALASGLRQLSRVFTAEQRVDLRYTRNQALPFFNLNSPDELAEAQSIIAKNDYME